MFKIAFIVLAVSASAFGVTIGFTRTTIPVYIDQPYALYNQEEDVFMITSSVEPVSRLFLEAGFGFQKIEMSDVSSYFDDDTKTELTAYSAGLYYALAESGTACLKTGISYRHSMAKLEIDEDNGIKTVMNGFGTLARLDFSFPGLEKVGFYTQVGVEYTKIESTLYTPSGEDEEDLYAGEGWSTTAPSYFIAGIYYNF